MKRPRFSIATLMLVVAAAGLGAWNWVLLAGMDDEPRGLILGFLGVVVAYPGFIILFAWVATLFGRWAPKGKPPKSAASDLDEPLM